MSELETRPSRRSVRRFLDAVEHPGRREDGYRLMRMMEQVTGSVEYMCEAYDCN